jgi:hypothetical protein
LRALAASMILVVIVRAAFRAVFHDGKKIEQVASSDLRRMCLAVRRKQSTRPMSGDSVRL